MRGKRASELDPEVRKRHEFEFEFLAGSPIIAGCFRKPPRRLTLEFAFADVADVGADHESEDMLGIDAFSMPAERKQRSHPNARNPNGFCANRHLNPRVKTTVRLTRGQTLSQSSA